MARACARHILVDSEDTCQQLKSEILAGSDFADVAKQHSKCPSGGQGGDLGEFGPGQMVKEFDKVVFSTRQKWGKMLTYSSMLRFFAHFCLVLHPVIKILNRF